MAEPFQRLQSALTDRYTLERELGRGGMATVYLAHDLRHHRHVALKVLDADLGSFIGRERFQREIEIAARLQHPNIIPLFDSGSSDDLLFYVMPFVAGESLRDRLDRETQLPLEDALAITREVSGALDYAHEQGVVHRDIKPANILLSEGHALVADFGIARAVAAAGGPEITERGLALGTPTYMSPEQASGRTAVDGRTDVYALGCVLYEMLAGQPPFTGPTVQAVLARHLQERPPSLQVVRPTVSSAVQRVVEVALAKVPADRYPTGGALVAALEVALTAKERRPWPRRRRTWIAAAVVAVCAAGIGIRSAKAPTLKLERISVFPVAARAADTRAVGLADEAREALLNALNTREDLKGDDPWPSLERDEKDDARTLSHQRARAVARRRGAGYYVLWRVTLGDSIWVMLELWDAAADSVAQRRTFAHPSATAGWTVGLDVADSIMPTLALSRWARLLRRAGPQPDLSALRGRDSSAIASFANGERAYRRAQFRDAFAYDSAAVARDTTFALAALRGAQAASWIGRYAQARTLIDVALRHGAAFSARYVAFAEGLDAYLAAQPDSAIRRFRRAIAFDPRWGEAWMALGEAYSHYLPREAPLDSLAEAAVTEARRWDPWFTPPLYDLVQFAVRRGDIGNARALMREFQASNPDSVELVSTELMLRCVEGSLDAVAWRRWAEQRPPLVIEAARMLTVGGLRQPRCAEAAWRAVLDHDTGVTNRWGALQGLQSVLVAKGRYAEVRDLLDRSEFVGPRTRLPLAIFDLWAGAPMGREGARAADSLRAAYRAKPDSTRDDKLWYLGIWEAWRRSADAVRLLADSLGARAARTADAPTKASTLLMAQSLAAHAALARGDTVAALPLLEALAPTAHKSRLLWNPWESLGPERLLLARLRLARGDYEGAARDASYFDSPAAIPLAAFVSASLEIRIRAAQAMHRDAVVAGLERRLAALRSAAP